MRARRPRILFLCTGNACRSQMAEGWARELHGDRYEIHSAGIVAHGRNPHAVEAMDALGVDIGDQESTPLAALGELEFDAVITVCDHAAQNLPELAGAPLRLHEPFPDPPTLAEARSEGEAAACYREVAERIGAWVRELPDRL